VALKYRYPQTLHLAFGAREYIRVDLQDFGGAHNAARFARFQDDALKDGAQWRFAFVRAGDSPHNAMHSIPAVADVDSQAAGEIRAHWTKVDIPPGHYDMWTVLQLPAQEDVLLRRDRVDVL